MSTHHRCYTSLVLAAALAACGDSRKTEQRPTVTTSTASVGILAGRNAPMAALVDSADAALRRGDTTGARGYIARAAARTDNDPATWYRLGRAAEQAGDVPRAALAYRGYLASPPPGADTQAVRERLTTLLFGAPPSDVTASAPDTTSRADATSRVAATPRAATRSPAAAAPPRTMVPSRPRGTPVAARPTTPRRERTTAAAARPSVQGRVASVTPVAPVMPAPPSGVAPPLTAAAEPTVQATAPGQVEPADAPTGLASAPALPPLPPREDRVDDNPPHKHWPWTAMQHWLVARMAALGGTGGAIVGAIIGNVPGAIALGSASGAAAGLSKVEREKRDSARVRAARAREARVAARRVVRDSAAGEVAVPDSAATTAAAVDTTTRARRDSAARLP